MSTSLYARFTFDFYRHWVTQVSLLLFIKGIKILRLSDRYTEHDVLNSFINNNEKLIDKLIENGDLKITEESNILHCEIKPSVDKYPGKCILFTGGRNGIQLNIQFCRRLSEYLGITIITSQYSGYYKSGNSNGLDSKSYIDTINTMYKLATNKYDTYIVGYSLGCYGGYLINEKDRIFLISPFYSLQKAIKDVVQINNFNLGNLLEEKQTKEIIIHGFYGDLINHVNDLIGPFKNNNVKINYHFGNHGSGLSNILFDDIKRYIDSFKNDFII